MSFKKLLSIISVVVVTMFVLMLTTSYAWYAYQNGSTTFDVATNNDRIEVSYQKGEYINTSVAVPIASTDVDRYSEKNNFTVRVKNSPIDNEMLLTVSLVDISIDGNLQRPSFVVDFYYRNEKISTVLGNTINTGSATTKTLGTVTLDPNIDNYFEIRVYILDDGTNQNVMMNKTFQAKIQLDTVSRVKTIKTEYNNPDIYVSSITIDGKASNNLPTSGYYTMSSTCSKGSNLSWEPFTKTITYENGSKIADSCSLAFTTATSTKLLSEVEPGSYVKYTGTNGCSGNTCRGDNANYVNDDNMGYCNQSSYSFIVNGWRVGYIKDGSAYLVSAGSPECVCTSSDGSLSNSSCSDALSGDDMSLHLSNLDRVALKYCNKDFAYGGVCDTNSTWAMDNVDFQNITGNVFSSTSCFGTYGVGTRTCGYNNDLIDNGGYYWYATFLGNQYNSQPLGVYWSPYNRVVIDTDSSYYGLSSVANGLRPVIKLKSTVLVVGGSGTYDDPYVIANS
mgnify:CR=1 FL=1